MKRTAMTMLASSLRVKPVAVIVPALICLLFLCIISLGPQGLGSRTGSASRFHTFAQSSGDKHPRVHFLLPASEATEPLCAGVASALANRLPIPILLGYQGLGRFDAKAAHIAKIAALQRYLRRFSAKSDNDLVIVADGFDVSVQLPADVIIQRYFDITAKADERLADQHGVTVQEAHRRGLRQSIVWGTDKGCFPLRMDEAQCWLIPTSTSHPYIFGPETGNGQIETSDSQFLNSGTVIGPLKDLREFIDAVMQHIEKTYREDEQFRNSDQYYVSQLYARQEYHRTLDLNRGEYPIRAEGKKYPVETSEKLKRTDFHVTVDFDSALTQTQCFNDPFLHNIQFSNFDRTATVPEFAPKPDSRPRSFQIQMPAYVYLSLARLYESLDAAVRPVVSTQDWIRSLSLATNVATRTIYPLYHNTCDKTHFVDKIRNSWFYPLLPHFLRSAAVANRANQPINDRPIDGRSWYHVSSYPRGFNVKTELGGVFSDSEDAPFLPLREVCGQHLGDVFARELVN